MPGVTSTDGGAEQGLDAADPLIWKAGPPSEGQVALAPRLEAGGKSVHVSHAWDEPASWSKWFGAQAYVEVKQLQVTEAMRGLAQWMKLQSEGGDDPPFRVWVDHSCLPQAIKDSDQVPVSSDHDFGPFKIQVKALKAILPTSQDAGRFYSMLTIPAEGFQYNGVLQNVQSDDPGQATGEDEAELVEWSLLPGQYFFTAAQRLSHADGDSPDSIRVSDHVRPGQGDLLCWCTDQALDDEAWIRIGLASVRGACSVLFDSMLTLHSYLVPVVTWNYFGRLWPLVEWAIFCSRVGVDKVHLAADFFTKPALVEFHRALSSLSIEGAECHNPSDRRWLLSFLEREFTCTSKYVTPCFQKVTKGVLMAVKERTVDFEPLERYIRATAVAIFARQAARTASRRLKCDDESGWIGLADSLGLSELHGALKRCKCWEWHQVAQSDAGVSQPEGSLAAAVELAYQARVEAWWADFILPVLEDERRRALRPATAMAVC